MKSPKEVVKWNSTLFIILLKCVSSRTLISCTHFKTSIFLLITVVTFTTSFGHCIRVVLFNFFGLPVGKKRLLFPFGSRFMKICSNAAWINSVQDCRMLLFLCSDTSLNWRLFTTKLTACSFCLTFWSSDSLGSFNSVSATSMFTEHGFKYCGATMLATMVHTHWMPWLLA